MARRKLFAVILGLTLIVSPREVNAVNGLKSEDVLLLARIVTSEITWRRGTNDPAAIHQVLMNRPGGREDLAGSARRYSRRATGEAPPLNARQAWVSALGFSLQRPEALPERYDWQSFRAAWRYRLEEAAALVEEPRNPCDGNPHHWGGAMDDARAHRAGWVRLECGPTLNHFWCVPARGCPRQSSHSVTVLP